jgi:hypothetical protein
MPLSFLPDLSHDNRNSKKSSGRVDFPASPVGLRDLGRRRMGGGKLG